MMVNVHFIEFIHIFMPYTENDSSEHLRVSKSAKILFAKLQNN